MHKRVGDTLVEVTLALGIFSMVAIAVIAVVSGSSSGAQASLETTVTREQIDSQAEALRFIHNSYIADVKTDQDAAGNEVATQTYTSLWRAVTNRANTEDEFSEEELRAYLTPSTCADVYYNSDNTLSDHGAFIINTRFLSDVENRRVNDIIITPESSGTSGNMFRPAVTFPRLVYDNGDISSYLEDNTIGAQRLTGVEGLFVIPVKDADSTTIVTSETIEHGAAYYDFYIMSCWYAGSSDRPSTISTVIRLYDPDVVTESAQDHSVKISFNGNGATSGKIGMEKIPFGSTFVLPGVENFYKKGYTFVGWSTEKSSTAEDVKNGLKNETVQTYLAGETYQAPNWLDAKYSDYKTFYAIWEPIPYTLHISYDTQGGNNIGEAVYYNVKYMDTINIDVVPTRNNYFFIGWTVGASYSDESLTSWNRNSTTQILTAGNNTTDVVGADMHLTLNANWEPNYHISYSTDSVQQINSQYCNQSSGDCYITTDAPTKSGYLFNGWCTKSVAAGQLCSGSTFYSGNTIDFNTLRANADSDNNVTLYAIWGERNETITILAEWTSDTDYDSYISYQKPGSNYYSTANYATTNINVTYSGQTYSIITGYGDGRASMSSRNQYYEKFIINTLGGKNFYYSMRRYSGYINGKYTSGGNIGDDIKVTVSGQYMGTVTYYSKDLNCQGNYWNIFGFKDGTIVNRNTCSANSMEYDY